MGKMIKVLADIFRVINYSLGISAPLPDATPAQQRSFVLMWVGIIVFLIAWGAFLLYILL